MTTFPATVMLLGSGELGKEVAIAAQRLGCRVIACDRYAGAPAMQVADQAEVLPMTEPKGLLKGLPLLVAGSDLRIGTAVRSLSRRTSSQSNQSGSG